MPLIINLHSWEADQHLPCCLPFFLSAYINVCTIILHILILNFFFLAGQGQELETILSSSFLEILYPNVVPTPFQRLRGCHPILLLPHIATFPSSLTVWIILIFVPKGMGCQEAPELPGVSYLWQISAVDTPFFSFLFIPTQALSGSLSGSTLQSHPNSGLGLKASLKCKLKCHHFFPLAFFLIMMQPDVSIL